MMDGALFAWQCSSAEGGLPAAAMRKQQLYRGAHKHCPHLSQCVDISELRSIHVFYFSRHVAEMDTTKGRCMVANEDIPPGALVLREGLFCQSL